MKSAHLILIFSLGLFSCSVAHYFPSSLAEKAYEEGDYANAIRYYLKAVADRDHRAGTFYWLGMSFYRHGDLEEAMLAMERSYEKDSSDVVVIERLAAFNLDLGYFDKASYYCRKAIRLDDEYVESYNTLGHVFFEAGQLDSAEYYFGYVLTLSASLRWESLAMSSYVSYAEPRAEANNGLGEVSIARASYLAALEYFTTANSLALDWETPWFNKGRVYEALGNSWAAEVAYHRAIDIAPGITGAHKNLARIFRGQGRDAEAMSLYARAISVDSTDVEAYYGLAELQDLRGDKLAAADSYSSAADMAPNDPDACSRAGRANLLAGNYDLAIEYFSSAVELQPQRAGAHNALGEAFRLAGDTVEARRSFETAIAIDSLFATPLRNLGSMMHELGRDSDAMDYFRRAARLGDGKAIEFLRSRGIGLE